MDGTISYEIKLTGEPLGARSTNLTS